MNTDQFIINEACDWFIVNITHRDLKGDIEKLEALKEIRELLDQ